MGLAIASVGDVVSLVPDGDDTAALLFGLPVPPQAESRSVNMIRRMAKDRNAVVLL